MAAPDACLANWGEESQRNDNRALQSIADEPSPYRLGALLVHGSRPKPGRFKSRDTVTGCSPGSSRGSACLTIQPPACCSSLASQTSRFEDWPENNALHIIAPNSTAFCVEEHT